MSPTPKQPYAGQLGPYVWFLGNQIPTGRASRCVRFRHQDLWLVTMLSLGCRA